MVRQALAAAKEELVPMLGPLLPLLQAVHAQHYFPCCLAVVGTALDFCGQLDACRAGLAAAVGAFVRATLHRLQVSPRLLRGARLRAFQPLCGSRGLHKACSCLSEVCRFCVQAVCRRWWVASLYTGWRPVLAARASNTQALYLILQALSACCSSLQRTATPGWHVQRMLTQTGPADS